jgi:hypothetical protein
MKILNGDLLLVDMAESLRLTDFDLELRELSFGQDTVYLGLRLAPSLLLLAGYSRQ